MNAGHSVLLKQGLLWIVPGSNAFGRYCFISRKAVSNKAFGIFFKAFANTSDGVRILHGSLPANVVN